MNTVNTLKKMNINPFAGVNIENLDTEKLWGLFWSKYMDRVLAYNIEDIPLITQIFFNANKPRYEKLLALEEIDYNPLENYNMTEELDETETEEQNTQKQTRGDTTITNATTETQELTDTKQVFAYDSPTTGRNSEKNIVDGSTTTGGTSTSESEITDEIGANKDKERKTIIKRTGNIGTMTTQTLIRQEREIQKFSAYNYICGDFVNKICISIY